MDFDTALYNFCEAINKGFKECSKKYDNLSYGNSESDYFHPIEIKAGRKNIKLISQNSVYCFVNKHTGDIYKAASWSIPAKGSRANIYDVNSYKDCDLSGTRWLYR